MNRKIKKELKYFIKDLIPEERFKRWEALKKELGEMEQEIVEQFRQSPHAEYLRAMSIRAGLDHYSDVRPRLDSTWMYVTVDLIGDDDQNAPQFIDPALLNTLLHGKLLSETEKRQLLEERGIIQKNDPIAEGKSE